MLERTSGIVISTVKYGESSLIVKIYTQKYGVLSFIASGIHNKSSNTRASLFQMLSLLELVYYHKENRDLHRLKELKASPPIINIQCSIVRSSIGVFMAEVLNKVLQQHEKDEELFQFIRNQVLLLNNSEIKMSFFPHFFLLGLSYKLGFGPSLDEDAKYFSLQEGVFTNILQPNGKTVAYFDESFYLKQMLKSSIADELPIPIVNKNKILDLLIAYFGYHLPFFGNIKSVEIIKEVFYSK